MQSVGLGILVTFRTHQPLWTGLVAAAAFLPVGLISPIGGVLADRLDRRKWLIATTIGEAAFAGVLTWMAFSGNDAPVWDVLIAMVGSIFSSLGFPSYQAMLPELVGKEQLLSAVSLSSAQYNFGRVIGPALAGIAIAFGSYGFAFLINAISFLAVIVALLLIKLPKLAFSGDLSDGQGIQGATPESTNKQARDPQSNSNGQPESVDGTNFMASLRMGAVAAWALPSARAAIVSIGVIALFGSPFIALIPAMAINTLRSGKIGTSVLVTSQGIGAVIGAVFASSLANKFGRERLLAFNLATLPFALLLYGSMPNLILSSLALFIVGGVYIGVLSGLNTSIQLSVPNETRGRILSFYMMTLGTLYPVGSLVFGWIANSVGVRWVTIGGAAILILIGCLIVMRSNKLVAGLGIYGQNNNLSDT